MRGITASVLTITMGIALTTGARAQNISGSAHDFSGEDWNTTGEICAPCHTPHNAMSTIVPLWNHDTSTGPFTLYTSPSLDATVEQPGSASLACLSCHDGTVAMDSFGGNTGSELMTGSALLGSDLSDDHPVSFVYDGDLVTADGGLHDPISKTTALGGSIDDDLLLDSRMECSSCHDVHNASGLDGLLVIDNAGSALCLTCHDK